MTTVNCSSNEELDFGLTFGVDTQQHSLGPAGGEPDDRTPYYTQVLANQPTGQHPSPPTFQDPSSIHRHQPSYEVHSSQYSSLGHPKAFDCPSIQITSIAPNSHQEPGSCHNAVPARGLEGGRPGPDRSWSRDHLYLPLEPGYRDATLSPSPCSSLSSRSWLSDLSSCESFSHIYDDVEAELNEAAAGVTLGSPLASPLPSPGCGGGAFGVEIWQLQYQHPLLNSLSSYQSPRQSPCASPRHSPRTSVTDENWLNPRPPSRSSSRPTSPCGKRRHSSADVGARSPSPHHSPSPTPGHSPRGSVTEDTWGGSPAAGLMDADVPSKTRRTSRAHMVLLAGQGDSGLDDPGIGLPQLDSSVEECVAGVNQDGLAELFLSVPSHFTWNKPKQGNSPLFRLSSPPSLDCPLPSQDGQYELKIEVQPKAHHRAHYETEGSRGAVKAASGGHPVVKLVGYSETPVNLQVFIGTADDRFLRPHAFYQVHRVTGKTVSTACQENIITSTKVLEIPLLPENSMSNSIDCAGILKLRNSDIELRKGETDIGRKNTRVRMAFRVHIPQPGGRILCLQAASVPIECSQRSAQELPQVDSFSPVSCSVNGGEELVITGSNISPETKVIFVEKGPDGRTQWEVDANVIQEKSNSSSIVVDIPAYHSKTVTSTVQVQFYVSNGKRKRSQTQGFTYLGAATHHYPAVGDSTIVTKNMKQEHSDIDYVPHNPSTCYPISTQLRPTDQAFPQDTPFYGSPEDPVPCGRPPQPGCYSLGSSPQQSSPHLHGYLTNMGHQRISPMQAVNPKPASLTRPSYNPTPYSVPYSNQPCSVMASCGHQFHPQIQAQATVAASMSSRREGMTYQSAIQPQLASSSPQPASQARAHAPAQGYSLSYHCSHTGSDQAEASHHTLKYHPTRDVSSSYSPAPAAPACSIPPSASPVGSPRRQAPSLGPSRTSLASDPQKTLNPAPHSLFSNSVDRVSIKQEPEEKLHEITLDDVNEIIDRDISQIGSVAEAVLPGQDRYGWDQTSGETALQFCGLH
ncbi:nuclear factor of activated T-cells, cytoplasmic 3-like [Osmerus mordax]|uniref:nuclear factor of activated T-cells, cytoplasmic 3-like n=1 Tax=Osmerus mordax TaxID=8014 RepID=UPI003510C80D